MGEQENREMENIIHKNEAASENNLDGHIGGETAISNHSALADMEEEPQLVVSKKKSALLVPLVVIASVFVLAVAGCFSFYFVSGSHMAKARTQMKNGQKYLRKYDYEHAAASFERAVRIDPKNIKAYICLADANEKMADAIIQDSSDEKAMQEAVRHYQRAADVLNRGYERTNSDKILSELNDMNIRMADRNIVLEGIDIVLNREREQDASDIPLSDDDGRNEDIPDGQKDSAPEIGSLTINVSDILQPENGVTEIFISLMKNDQIVENSIVNAPGEVVFESLEFGEYEMQMEKDGYYPVTEKVNVSAAENIANGYLLKKMENDDAYIVLAWNTESDVDIRMFNAETNQYVCLGTPVDEGGSFLYSDNQGVSSYEIIYLRDFSAETARTFYAVDYGSLSGEKDSQMEADGISVSVYTKDGEIYTDTADEWENSSIWQMFYIFGGKVYGGAETYAVDAGTFPWEKDGSSKDEDGSPEAIADELVRFYTDYWPLREDEGNYVMFVSEFDFEETDSEYIFILRYQRSEQEVEDLMDSGIIPDTNIYVTQIWYDKNTGRIRDEKGTDMIDWRNEH